MAPASVFDDITADVVLIRDMEGFDVVGGLDVPERDGRESVVAAVVAAVPSMKRNRGAIVSG